MVSKEQAQKTVTLIRIRRVMTKTGISKSQVYRLAHLGEFPKPIKLTAQSVAWIEQEVEDWISQRIAQRDSNKEVAL